MTGKTHILGGTASLWVFYMVPYGFPDPYTLTLCCVAAAVGAGLPDLDSRYSILQNVSIKGIRPFVPVGWMVRQAFPHRGPMHSLAATYAWTTFVSFPLAYYFGWQVGLAFTLGYLSHLILDMCTVRGLMLMWPSRRPYWALPMGFRIVTGSDWETLFTVLLAVMTFALFIIQVLNLTI